VHAIESRLLVSQQRPERLSYQLAEKIKLPNGLNRIIKSADPDGFKVSLNRYPELSLQKLESTSASWAVGSNKAAVS
jgi:hypothetical protein